jgi:hypothetical protein
VNSCQKIRDSPLGYWGGLVPAIPHGPAVMT